MVCGRKGGGFSATRLGFRYDLLTQWEKVLGYRYGIDDYEVD